MANNNSSPGENRGLDDVEEIEPNSKQGQDGNKANEGRLVGPNSDEAGKPQAPQTGDPRRPDRAAS